MNRDKEFALAIQKSLNETTGRDLDELHEQPEVVSDFEGDRYFAMTIKSWLQRGYISTLHGMTSTGGFGSGEVDAEMLILTDKGMGYVKKLLNPKFDDDLANDLVLSIENDGSYYQTLKTFLLPLAKKYAKGKFSVSLGERQMYNVIVNYLPIYKKNAGSPYLRVSRLTKLHAAEELLKSQMELIEDMSEDYQ